MWGVDGSTDGEGEAAPDGIAGLQVPEASADRLSPDRVPDDGQGAVADDPALAGERLGDELVVAPGREVHAIAGTEEARVALAIQQAWHAAGGVAHVYGAVGWCGVHGCMPRPVFAVGTVSVSGQARGQYR